MRLTMAANRAAVFGIFASSLSAEIAVHQLTTVGFSTQDISVLMSDTEEAKELAAERNTNAGKDATNGIGEGGGPLLAEAGALAISGAGPLVAAGPIIKSLAGSDESGLVGALLGLGIPEYEAKLYDGKIRAGGVMLSIHCLRLEEVSKARDLMNEAGADDIASFEEQSIAGLKVEQGAARSSIMTNTPLAAINVSEAEAF
jgi:Heat induced stress protein YflT